MKNATLVLVFFLTSFFAGAQNIKESKVPAPVLKNFKKENPNLVVKSWEKEGKLYEAEVEVDGKERSIVYDEQGNFVAKEEEVGASEMPPMILDYLIKNFPGMVAQEYTRVVKADGTASYEADINDQDLLFDATGNFTGKEKDDADDKD